MPGRCISLKVILAVTSFLIPHPAPAQWIPTNTPQGFTATVLAVDDSSIYAGHGRGLLVSHDRGVNWTPSTKGLPAGRITTLALRRVSGGAMIFAGTQNDGIYLSIDNGLSWSPVDQTPVVETEKHAAVIGAKAYYGGPTVFSLILSGKFLLAGMNFGGVYRSTNNGGSWSAASEGFTSSAPMGPPSITTLALSGEYIFAGTTGDGVFLSTNHGRQWTYASNGLPADGRSVYCPINALVSVPKPKRIDGENVFAATEGAGIFLTGDDGRRWVPVNNGFRNPVIYSLAASTVSNRACVFAGVADGVYLTTTNGSHWTNVTTGMLQAKVYALVAAGDTVYASVARNGVWKRAIANMIGDGLRKP